MNIQNLKSIASSMGLNNDAVNNALKLAGDNGLLRGNELEGTPEQFKKIVNSYGGMAKLDEGLKKLNNPLVKNALKLCGVDVEKAKEAALKAMGINKTTGAAKGSIADRLNKLL